MAKKVAIIGAGPSGLVTAKTLLHHHAPARFEPVVFDSRRTVGGLWAVKDEQDSASFIDRDMRTNLSRFTVCFSDFSWERNVFGNVNDATAQGDIDMFPRAAQVNEYLDKYAARYIPDSVLRLGCRVLQTKRRTSTGWTVQWTNQTEKREEEEFDYLVVASGYFSSPHIPSILGLDSVPPERVIHSSSLASAEKITLGDDDTNGKLLVVGGSMSGAEAAASLALNLSSSENIQVHHLTTRPFWAVPTYLPSKSGSFLPLDLVMYDLSRRPPGDIQYSLAPTIPPERAALVNGYFAAVLGMDQSDVARFDTDPQKSPPWVAVTDSYAEFVRAGDIVTSLGRVESVNWPAGSNRGSVQVKEEEEEEEEEEERSGKTRVIDDVAGIVLATGFTPFNALAFLPDDVLAALEYDPEDPVFPLLLDEKAALHPAVPDLGFVGMYRGPYWGVMEMQARSLAQRWDCDDIQQHENPPLQMSNPRLSSSSSSSEGRAQFPMGDYVGLIETFARELGIPRTSLSSETTETCADTTRTGPAVPVRYAVQTDTNKPEIAATRSALSSLLLHKERRLRDALAEAHAVFRALHGSWRVEERRWQADGTVVSNIFSATFRPRASSSSSSSSSSSAGTYEYLYHEDENNNNSPDAAVFSISEKNFIQISQPGSLLSRHLEFVAIDQEDDDDDAAPEYQYRHSARGVFSDRPASSQPEEETSLPSMCEYVFHFKGVQIISWRETMVQSDGRKQIKIYSR